MIQLKKSDFQFRKPRKIMKPLFKEKIYARKYN